MRRERKPNILYPESNQPLYVHVHVHLYTLTGCTCKIVGQRIWSRVGAAALINTRPRRPEGKETRSESGYRVDGEPTLRFPAIFLSLSFFFLFFPFFVSLFFSFPSVFVLNAVSRDRREIESEKELRDTHAEHCAPADRVAAFSQPIDLSAARQYVSESVLTLFRFFSLDTVGRGETENSRMIH